MKMKMILMTQLILEPNKPMKYSIKEFAKEIRKSYPKSYNDLSDDELVRLWIKKNPKDRKKIDFSSNSESKGCLNMVWNIVKSVLLFAFFSVIVVFLINVGVTFYEKHNKVSPNTTTAMKTPNVEIREVESFEPSIPITQDAKNLYSSSTIIKAINLDEKTKNTILQILSDPNPDPNNSSGTFCDNTTSRCAYCNNLVPGILNSYKEYLSLELDCENLFSVYNGKCDAAKYLIESGKNVDDNLDDYIFLDSFKGHLINFRNLIYDISARYEQGERYICIEKPINSGGQKFCSEKCKTEYSYTH